MAVFTHLSDAEIADYLRLYDQGQFVSAKPVVQGVENTNYVIETDKNRFILTLVEYRTPPEDVPFIVDFIGHLAKEGLSVPETIAMRDSSTIGRLKDKPCLLVPFLHGTDGMVVTATKIRSTATYLAKMHRASATHRMTRRNPVGVETWQKLHQKIGVRLNELRPNLYDDCAALIAQAINMNAALPSGSVHTDLFPDNVFFDDNEHVSAVFDFYFSCTAPFVYDLCSTANAWVFVQGQPVFWRDFIDAYQSVRPLSQLEIDLFSLHRRLAAMRFLLTRAHDWFFQPENALVKPKDPMEYVVKMDFVDDWF